MKRRFIVCILVGSAPSVFACDVVGVLDGLARATQRVDEVEKKEAWVERGKDKWALTNGMPLCRKDLLITSENITAILLLGAAGTEQKQITVSPHSSVLIQGAEKIEVSVGGIFARIKGLFDSGFLFGNVAATGTLYSLEVTSSGVRVVQFEGSTAFSRPGELPTNALAVPTNAEVSLATVPAPAVPKQMPFDRCKAQLDPNSQVVSETRAKRSSLAVSRNFERAAAGKIFAEARAGMFCRENQTAPDAKADAARVRLGLLYADWNEPEQAIRLLSLSASEATPEARARKYTAVGNAYRLEGQPDEALKQFAQSLEVSPGYAPAENGRGDALRDQGLKAYGITVQAKQKVSDLFDSARQSYEAAASHAAGTTELELALVNAGNLSLLRAGLYPDRGDEFVEQAQNLFEQAFTKTTGKSAHARLGLARVEMQRAQLVPQKEVDPTGLSAGQQFVANLVYGQQATEERKPIWKRAETILDALVADEPDFAPGWQTLGALYINSGKSSRAKKVLLNAMNIDPHHTITYKLLGIVGSDTYQDAYKTVEFPAMQTIAEKKEQLTRTSATPVPVPSNALIPDVSTLRFDSASNDGRTVAFKNVGEAVVTPTSAAISGSDAGAFAVTEDGCSNRQVAPKEGMCRIVVAFRAEKVGKYKATLELSAGGPISTTVELKGSVSAVPPATYMRSKKQT